MRGHLAVIVMGLAAGDQGFLTPTKHRDVQFVDVNNDGWLDIVTAVTLSAGLPKHVGHPRVYVNLGEGQPRRSERSVDEPGEEHA